MSPIMFGERLFPSLFDDFMPTANNTNNLPSLNIKETDTDYIMELSAHGISKNDCKVSLTDDENLNIIIEHKRENKNEDKRHRYLRREFSYSNYQNDFKLPDDADKDNISAHVENGILTVNIPKLKEQEKPKQKLIEVL